MNAAYLEEAQETNSPDWDVRPSTISTGPSELRGAPSASSALFGTPCFFTIEEPLVLTSLSESLLGDRTGYIGAAERHLKLFREKAAGRDLALDIELRRIESMIEHPDYTDEEDFPSFSITTLFRAKSFLLAQSKQFHKIFGYFPPVPQIGAGPNGSVDLYWKKTGWELLINIPAEDGKMATFYGDDYGLQKIKGSLDPNSFHYGIVPWLIRN